MLHGLTSLFLAPILLGPAAIATWPAPPPPVAVKIPRTTTVNGHARTDDYAWLRAKDTARVRAYFAAENDYATAVLTATAAVSSALDQEMTARSVVDPAETVPVPLGGYAYRTRVDPLDDTHLVLVRAPLAGAASEGVVMDTKRLRGVGSGLRDPGALVVSDDGKRVAVVDASEDDATLSTIVLRHIGAGAASQQSIARAWEPAFTADGASLLYVRFDATSGRASAICRHDWGTKAGSDKVVLEEADPGVSLDLARSRSGAWFIATSSGTAGEVQVIPADRPDAPPVVLVPRGPAAAPLVDHVGDAFVAVAPDPASGGALVATASSKVAAPRFDLLRPLARTAPGVGVTAARLFAGGAAVLVEEKSGFPRLERLDLATGALSAIALPAGLCRVTENDGGLVDLNLDPGAKAFRFALETLSQPRTVCSVDLASGAVTVLARASAGAGFDPRAYVGETLTIPARDGTEIPVSLVRKAGVALDGTAPLVLYGFGAYGIAIPDPDFAPCFAPERIPLLDRGVIFAIAHVRGGGELGEAWHQAGCSLEKMNSFTDFIDVADGLAARKVCAPDRIAAMGESAGGLLVTAATNLRPDRFRAVLALYPFVDVVDTMLDTSLPGTTDEFDEWGDPSDPVHYDSMMRWSPYDNVAPVAYPAMFLRGALHDDEVMVWEPAKLAAKLRAVGVGTRPLVLHIALANSVGHLGPADDAGHFHDRSEEFAFVLRELGVK